MGLSDFERQLRTQFGPNAKITVRPKPTRVIVQCKLCRYTCPAAPDSFGSGGPPAWSLAIWTNHLFVKHQIGTEAQLSAARSYVDSEMLHSRQKFVGELQTSLGGGAKAEQVVEWHLQQPVHDWW